MKLARELSIIYQRSINKEQSGVDRDISNQIEIITNRLYDMAKSGKKVVNIGVKNTAIRPEVINYFENEDFTVYVAEDKISIHLNC